jgi:hypothetical protein
MISYPVNKNRKKLTRKKKGPLGPFFSSEILPFHKKSLLVTRLPGQILISSPVQHQALCLG